MELLPQLFGLKGHSGVVSYFALDNTRVAIYTEADPGQADPNSTQRAHTLMCKEWGRRWRWWMMRMWSMMVSMVGVGFSQG